MQQPEQFPAIEVTSDVFVLPGYLPLPGLGCSRSRQGALVRRQRTPRVQHDEPRVPVVRRRQPGLQHGAGRRRAIHRGDDPAVAWCLCPLVGHAHDRAVGPGRHGTGRGAGADVREERGPPAQHHEGCVQAVREQRVDPGAVGQDRLDHRVLGQRRGCQ